MVRDGRRKKVIVMDGGGCTVMDGDWRMAEWKGVWMAACMDVWMDGRMDQWMVVDIDGDRHGW